MPRQLTLADIITHALDKDYTVEQVAIDLGELMTEREQTKRRYGSDTGRLGELESIIPVQQQLALGKLRGDQLFEQLEHLGIRLEKHD